MRRYGRGFACSVLLGFGLILGSNAASAESFEAWLEAFRQEALGQGIGAATLDQALDGLTPLPKVVELDGRQAEVRLDFRTYHRRVLSEERIRRGQRLLREHRALLDRVAADYGVQPRFIIALWGIESSYGEWRGKFPVVAALATLAHDGRRRGFFESELLKALRILDNGDIEIDDMVGSWAGAMGQSQFMPSSYLSYAVDYDGDGRRDIWNSHPDIFASIANYLAKAGWDGRYTWGREVRLPTSWADASDGLDVFKPLAEWQALGIRRESGRDLPMVALDAALLQPDEHAGPAYLVYKNFRALMNWNRSTYFGLTVGELSDLISHG